MESLNSAKAKDLRGRVAILLGLYNGAPFLQEQLDSLAAQTDPDWNLVVSDDGSQDSGPDMIRQFAQNQQHTGRDVSIVAGPRRGFCANFLSLLADTSEGTSWVALSDQDDVWMPTRLETGRTALSAIDPSTPALFGSATWIVEEDLSNRRLSPRFTRPPSFQNALVQSIAGGNMMMLNRAGADLARAAAREVLSADKLPETHDWWLYQLISGAGGQVIRSEEPTLMYRQHGGNLFGTNRGARARFKRLHMVTSGELAEWTARNAGALLTTEHRLTPENRDLLHRFSKLRTLDMVSRLRSFRSMGLYRHGGTGQAALMLAAALGRL